MTFQSMAAGMMVTTLMAVAVPAQAQDDPKAKAQGVLAEVAKAMGGDKAAGLKSLSAEGESRRTFGDREITGGVELHALLPDMFQQVSEMTGRTACLVRASR